MAGIEHRLIRRLLGLFVTCALAASACADGAPGSGQDTESNRDADAAEAADGGEGADDSVTTEGDEAGGDQTSQDSGRQGAGGADSSDGDGSGSGGSSAEPSPLVPSITADELAVRLSDLTGRLAIGNGPEVAVVRPDGLALEILDGSESVFASQPTWSHDGTKLAWSSASAERQVVQIQPFDDDGARQGEPLVSNGPGPPVFYLQWNDADDRLVAIRNHPEGGGVEVSLVQGGLPLQPVGRDAPFFVSWSPEPDRIVAHVNERAIQLLQTDPVPQSGFESVLEVDGGFSAPAWVDGRRALIVADGALALVDTESGTVEPVEPVAGPVEFVLSPDRTKVAYQTLGGGAGAAVISFPTPDPHPVQEPQPGLVVLELETGRRTTVTGGQAMAWEWSPDSRKLAWLGSEPSVGRPLAQWRFWSEEGPLPTEGSSVFGLTRKYGQSYLPFFAQYTQSVTGWSPDSTAFAFAGFIDEQVGIWIQLIDEVVAPQRVAVGDFVTWGPGTPPPADGAAESAR